MNICVFCASSTELDSEYYTLARTLGTWIGSKEHTLVYGAANIGMMGELARSAHKAGAKTVGIAPKIFDQSRHYSELDKCYITETFSERKQLMIDQSDAFIVMPGGVGTLDELFEILTLKRVENFSKPLILLNTNGFYSTLLTFIEELNKKHFSSETIWSDVQVVESIEEIKL